jgi:phage-related baseplate assembly protein
MPKAPATREKLLEQVRATLAEHFEVGLLIVSWEEEGTTFHMETKHGNDYALRELARRAPELLWPADYEDDDILWDDDEDDDEEEIPT